MLKLVILFKLLLTFSIFFGKETELGKIPKADDDIDKSTVNKNDLHFFDVGSPTLRAHNIYRLRYKIPILKEDNELVRNSRELAFRSLSRRFHENLSEEWEMELNPYGKNTYASEKIQQMDTVSIVRVWYSEIKNFNENMTFEEFKYIRNVTQILWKSTKRMGCSQVVPNFEASKIRHYLICLYYPPASFIGIDENFFKPVTEHQSFMKDGTFSYRPITLLLLMSFINLLNLDIYL